MDLASLRADWKRWGAARAVFRRVMRILDRYAGFHLACVFARPLTSSYTPALTDPRISIRLAQPEELYKAAEDPELELDPDFIREALASGGAAFAAFDGDTMVGHIWRTSTAVPHADGLWVRVAPPYGYGYKTLVRESHRGKGIAIALSFVSDAYGRERGYIGTVGFVEVTNYPSLSVERAKCCRPVGYVGYVTWFGHSFPFRSRGARTIGLELLVNDSKQCDELPPTIPVS